MLLTRIIQKDINSPFITNTDLQQISMLSRWCVSLNERQYKFISCSKNAKSLDSCNFKNFDENSYPYEFDNKYLLIIIALD